MPTQAGPAASSERKYGPKGRFRPAAAVQLSAILFEIYRTSPGFQLTKCTFADARTFP
jgi:hypothetical protein